MLFSSSSCFLFHTVLGGKEQKLLFFMKCSPQIALYVSSCFMQSLCACSRVELLAHGQGSGKNQRNTKTIFIQHFLNVLIPWSPWIFFLLLLFRFSLFLFLLHRHSWNFYTSSVERKHPRKPTVTIKTNTIAQVHFHRGRGGKRVGEGLYSEGLAKRAGPGMKRACSKVSTSSKEKKARARRAPLSL